MNAPARIQETPQMRASTRASDFRAFAGAAGLALVLLMLLWAVLTMGPVS